MRHKEIRDKFYNYFISKKHKKVLSSPLIPAKDPTLLFTNAGMNQFKSVFLQEEKREYNRAVTIQKCMRVSGKHNDFDEVGKTEYHHTFFEMLGNFSFGDYFKEQAIEFAWELLTEHFKFNPKDLWITVYKDDDEAFNIWEKKIGIPSNKIIRLGEKDNFWQMGETGPCGPCSEIHFDKGETFGKPDIENNSKRFIEVWNLVFMQYFKDEKGNLNPLPAPSIDTGMGMERLTSLLQKVDSNYKTDLFMPIIDYTSDLCEKDFENDKYQIDFKVIADHIRALTFLISDGVLPSNEGRGYVLRRILRRASKHGKSLGFTKPFLFKISDVVVKTMKESYPELEFNKKFISEVILSEEERFNRTLSNGLRRFEEILNKAEENSNKIISGKDLFKLSDTYGFPVDFAMDLANEKNIEIDFNGYKQELEVQRERSRKGAEKKFAIKSEFEKINEFETDFIGYNDYESNSKVLGIYIDGELKNVAKTGQKVFLVFDKTPFYAESGGQISDIGDGNNENSFIKVINVQKINNAFLHEVEIKTGEINIGDVLRIKIDIKRRKRIAIHHSLTHLLHAALREVLGLHVKQAGSYVGEDKLRFDFTHFKQVSSDELILVERIVNQKIRDNLDISCEILDYNVAIEKGAMAIFEEKYSDKVRVISMGDFSKELCGGTHLSKTGDAGYFKIISESSISSGIRRIEALGGDIAENYVNERIKTINQLNKLTGKKDNELIDFVKNLETKLKEKERIINDLKRNTKKIDIDEIIRNKKSYKKADLIIEYMENTDRKQLSGIADEIKKKIPSIVILFSNENDKSIMVVSIEKKLSESFNAGEIVREIAGFVNGRGGGRRDFANGGGSKIENIEDFKQKVYNYLENKIN